MKIKIAIVTFAIMSILLVVAISIVAFVRIYSLPLISFMGKKFLRAPSFYLFHPKYILDKRELMDSVLGDTDWMTIILDSGFDINSYNDSGETPLHDAVGRDYVETASFLIAHGANINQQTNYFIKTSNKYPIHLATHRFSKEMLQLLLDNGADINTLDAKGRTPLDIVSRKFEYEGALKYYHEHLDKKQEECRIFIEQCGGKHACELLDQNLKDSSK